MLETKRIGVVGILGAAILFAGFGMQNATAQLNEKRVERKATGKYTGSITTSKVQTKTDGVPDGPFMEVGGGDGKVRVPVKDGKLKSTARDEEIPADGAAKFTGTEKKSDVRRNGKKIVVKAKGAMDLINSGHVKTKGQVAGKIIQGGSKHVADVRFKGERNDGVHSTCYNTKVKGKM